VRPEPGQTYTNGGGNGYHPTMIPAGSSYTPQPAAIPPVTAAPAAPAAPPTAATSTSSPTGTQDRIVIPIDPTGGIRFAPGLEPGLQQGPATLRPGVGAAPARANVVPMAASASGASGAGAAGAGVVRDDKPGFPWLAAILAAWSIFG
jgi:hypothetical protein